MIYFDNGATSFPKVPGMSRVMKECIDRYCGNPGRSGHAMSVKTGEEVYRARKSVAKVFGIKDPGRLVFTSNTTTALNMGIRGVLGSGDHAVTTAMEHNSVLRPLRALEDEGVSSSIVSCESCGRADPQAIAGAIRENTRLVVMAHASNVTGTLQDIESVGHMIWKINENRDPENRILFMIDGAQSAGCVPIDVDELKIDLLAVPGHKGLLGPLGTGALYVREGVNIYPTIAGGTGTASKEREQPLDFPEGFEAGTVNAPGIIGLGYSAEWVMKCGVEKIRKYEEELISPLQEALLEMRNVRVYGPRYCESKTAVVTFNIASGAGPVALGCEEVSGILAREYGIATRGGYHCAGLAHKTIGTWDTGAVRLSAGPFNTRKEIKTAIDAIFKISKMI